MYIVQPLPYDFRGKHIKNFAKFVSERKEGTHTVLYAVYSISFPKIRELRMQKSTKPVGQEIRE